MSEEKEKIDYAEIMMEVEAEFGVCIDEDTAERLKSVGDIAAFVDGQLKQKDKEE